MPTATSPTPVDVIRRLDHVAIAVVDTTRAAAEIERRLGLQVVHSEELAQPAVRLSYIDAGNCYIQLVEPLDPTGELAQWLETHGQGVHHVCFGVESVPEAVSALSDGSPPGNLGSGRGRVSGFVPGQVAGVRVECTEFRHREDVEATPGWLES